MIENWGPVGGRRVLKVCIEFDPVKELVVALESGQRLAEKLAENKVVRVEPGSSNEDSKDGLVTSRLTKVLLQQSDAREDPCLC